MAHLVRHRTPSGETVTAEVADLEAAVSLVERLRNDEKADDVRVYAEVPLRFETYVKVSIAAEDTSVPVSEQPAEVVETAHESAVDEPPAGPVAPVPPPPGVLAPVRVEAPSADADELVDATPADARRGLFNRG